MGLPGGFLGRLPWPLIKTGLSLIKDLLKSLGKSVLMSLGLTAAAAATDATIFDKNFWLGTTALIISNEEINDIKKIVKSVEESGLLIKGISETVKCKAKKEKGRFLIMLLDTLGASLLGNLLTGNGKIRSSEGTMRAGQYVTSSFN